jgi:TRAP-type C4-dicarboxylate transport system permease small subunit
MIQGINRILQGIEEATGLLAALVMFLIMVIAAADVGMRYVFNSPFSWAYDLIGLYLMTGLFYFVLSGTFAHHAHVSVDILQHYMTPRQRRLCEIVVCALSLLLFAAITYAGAERALVSYSDGDVLAGLIPWPTWPSIALVPFGAGLLTLRLALHLVAHLGAVITGIETIELTPVSGSPEAMEREMVE